MRLTVAPCYSGDETALTYERIPAQILLVLCVSCGPGCDEIIVSEGRARITDIGTAAIIRTAMNQNGKLTLLKILHTVIWAFFYIVLFYLLYAVSVNKIDKWIWICLGLITAEGIVLLIFKGVCPVTLIARKYSDSPKDNFDIYLPKWLAKYNKKIYSVAVFIALMILFYRLIIHR